MKNAVDAQCDLLNCKSVLILEEDEIHIQTQLWGFRSLERRVICILLGKDKKAPFINLRSQVKNMLVHS